MAIHSIKKPYLLLIGHMENPNNAKTAFGLRDWTPEVCVGQLRFGDKAVDLGLPQMSPLQAVSAGARTLVIGIAPPGDGPVFHKTDRAITVHYANGFITCLQTLWG